MEDPFTELLKSLQPLFNSETLRNDRYTYRPVQALKETSEHYNPENKLTFIRLLKAIADSSPYIEKWGINFDTIKKYMNALAKKQDMPEIEWNLVLKNKRKSPRFQFGNYPPNEQSLIDWLSSIAEKNFNQINQTEKTQILIENKDHNGFSKKLSSHLIKHPDFLFQLIMESESNFNKISATRLSLYLTDTQIANALIKYIPEWADNHADPFDQVERLVNKLNTLLSNGRSVTTLLRNAQAKSILNQSKFFQIFQSDEYKDRNNTTPNPINLKI